MTDQIIAQEEPRDEDDNGGADDLAYYTRRASSAFAFCSLARRLAAASLLFCRRYVQTRIVFRVEVIDAPRPRRTDLHDRVFVDK